jgi:hypothetical protein
MISIDKTLVSEELLEKEFVCDLSACKGACCVEGTGGAPLEEEEIQLLKNYYPLYKEYLTPKGIAVIEKEGFHAVGDDGGLETPLIEGGACVFIRYDDDGTAKCGVEQAHIDGKIPWKKPVSCHLYPARVDKYASFEAVNYHKWDICAPACDCGANLKVPVYKFLKEALIRKFGAEWYAELELVDKELKKQA